jgi:hypothetical protein
MINPMEETAQKSIDWLKTASDEEFTRLLQKAGVLDQDGHLAERYRPPGAPPPGQPARAAGAARPKP